MNSDKSTHEETCSCEVCVQCLYLVLREPRAHFYSALLSWAAAAAPVVATERVPWPSLAPLPREWSYPHQQSQEFDRRDGGVVVSSPHPWAGLFGTGPSLQHLPLNDKDQDETETRSAYIKPSLWSAREKTSVMGG